MPSGTTARGSERNALSFAKTVSAPLGDELPRLRQANMPRDCSAVGPQQGVGILILELSSPPRMVLVAG